MDHFQRFNAMKTPPVQGSKPAIWMVFAKSLYSVVAKWIVSVSDTVLRIGALTPAPRITHVAWAVIEKRVAVFN